jgi:hypothetical protein
VVATIDVPASHQGTRRSERKYSLRLRPARREKARAMTNEKMKYARMTSQSTVVRIIEVNPNRRAEAAKV